MELLPDAATALRIAGLWPTGRPSVLLRVRAASDAIALRREAAGQHAHAHTTMQRQRPLMRSRVCRPVRATRRDHDARAARVARCPGSSSIRPGRGRGEPCARPLGPCSPMAVRAIPGRLWCQAAGAAQGRQGRRGRSGDAWAAWDAGDAWAAWAARDAWDAWDARDAWAPGHMGPWTIVYVRSHGLAGRGARSVHGGHPRQRTRPDSASLCPLARPRSDGPWSQRS